MIAFVDRRPARAAVTCGTMGMPGAQAPAGRLLALCMSEADEAPSTRRTPLLDGPFTRPSVHLVVHVHPARRCVSVVLRPRVPGRQAPPRCLVAGGVVDGSQYVRPDDGDAVQLMESSNVLAPIVGLRQLRRRAAASQEAAAAANTTPSQVAEPEGEFKLQIARDTA